MPIHLKREIDKLKIKLLSLSAIIEDQVRRSVKSIEQRDKQLAIEVIHGDTEVDRAEVEIEEDCLKILALHQPVAVDLRFIVAVLKINNDLERIGDLAVNIARKVAMLASQPSLTVPFDLVEMSEESQAMLRDSLDSLVNLDTSLALDVCERDDRVDQMKRDIRHQIEDMLRNTPEHISLLLKLLAASRNIERIADLATNIAEDVIYMVEGKIIRHCSEGGRFPFKKEKDDINTNN